MTKPIVICNLNKNNASKKSVLTNRAEQNKRIEYYNKDYKLILLNPCIWENDFHINEKGIYIRLTNIF